MPRSRTLNEHIFGNSIGISSAPDELIESRYNEPITFTNTTNRIAGEWMSIYRSEYDRVKERNREVIKKIVNHINENKQIVLEEYTKGKELSIVLEYMEANKKIVNILFSHHIGETYDDNFYENNKGVSDLTKMLLEYLERYVNRFIHNNSKFETIKEIMFSKKEKIIERTGYAVSDKELMKIAKLVYLVQRYIEKKDKVQEIF